MLGEAGNEHPDDSFEIRERLFRCCPPSRPAAHYQRRTISVPAVIVRLDYDFEGVSGQLVTLPLGVGAETGLSHTITLRDLFLDAHVRTAGQTHGKAARNAAACHTAPTYQSLIPDLVTIGRRRRLGRIFDGIPE